VCTLERGGGMIHFNNHTMDNKCSLPEPFSNENVHAFFPVWFIQKSRNNLTMIIFSNPAILNVRSICWTVFYHVTKKK
jgi:hypothetical protein